MRRWIICALAMPVLALTILAGGSETASALDKNKPTGPSRECKQCTDRCRGEQFCMAHCRAKDCRYGVQSSGSRAPLTSTKGTSKAPSSKAGGSKTKQQ